MIIGNVLREYKITFGDMIREEEAALSLPAELLQEGLKLRLIKERNLIMDRLIKVRRKNDCRRFTTEARRIGDGRSYTTYKHRASEYFKTTES